MQAPARFSLAYGSLVVLAALAAAFAPLPGGAQGQAAERVVRVQAGQFSYSPAVISANPGDRVTIELVSTDVVHGLYVDGYGVSVQADPGQTASLTFIADRSGSFRMRCNVTCGAMHPFMIGRLNVGANTSWLRAVGFMLVGLTGLALFPKPGTAGGPRT